LLFVYIMKREPPKKPREEKRPSKQIHRKLTETPHMRLMSLTAQSERTIYETKGLHERAEAITTVIKTRIKSGLPVSKEHALGWLAVRKQFLESSIRYWLLEHEIIAQNPISPAEKAYLNAKCLTALTKRQKFLAVLEKAAKRLETNEDTNKVLTEMQEEYSNVQ